MPLPERVSRLEEQVNNLVQMNLPQQIAELQQQVEKLNGQLQDKRISSTSWAVSSNMLKRCRRESPSLLLRR